MNKRESSGSEEQRNKRPRRTARESTRQSLRINSTRFIQKLPNELLAIIFTDPVLKRKDLFNIRYVCGRFSRIAVKYIFRTFYLRVSETSFKKLETVINHTNLFVYVQELVYDGNILLSDNMDTFEEWYDSILDQLNGRVRKDKVQAYYEIAKAYLRDQNRASSTSIVQKRVRYLGEFFRNLPALRIVRYKRWSRSPPNVYDRVWSQELWNRQSQRYRLERPESWNENLVDLITALAIGQRLPYLKELFLDHVSRSSIDDLYHYTNLWPEGVRLSSLERLSLNISETDKEKHRSRNFDLDLRDFIFGAKRLEELQLTLNNVLTVSRILDTIPEPWCYLTSLSLCCAVFPLEAFRSLLLNHAEKLRRLSLTGIEVRCEFNLGQMASDKLIWISDLIPWMSQELNLDEMCFNGSLSTRDQRTELNTEIWITDRCRKLDGTLTRCLESCSRICHNMQVFVERGRYGFPYLFKKKNHVQNYADQDWDFSLSWDGPELDASWCFMNPYRERWRSTTFTPRR